MTTETKKKLCWNCEGRVACNEEHCPYCGVYLSPALCSREGSEDDDEEYREEPERGSPHHLGRERVPGGRRPSTFDEEDEGEGSYEEEEEVRTAVLTSGEVRKMAAPMGMLLSGSIFFLFGLALLLFSREGVLTLQWDGEYWYIYLGLSLILLFLGWRSLQFVDD